MKKIYSFILLLSCTMSQAQTVTATTNSASTTATLSTSNESRYYNSWRFGINLGAMWQTADVRSTPGFAGGFTLEKGLFENKTNFFSLAIRGRGLFGTTYGLDHGRNYDVKFNPAFNGSYNKKVNYDSTSEYVYNNYRAEINEGALELQVCFNSLRERTNVLLNLWGGIGFISYRTKTNLLDANDKMYNYGLVDSTGGAASIITSHKSILDKSYESNARNSQNGNLITLSPSCGIGLGYKFSNAVSIIWEYKLTFPQGSYSDYLDGHAISNDDWLGCNKDYYHYTALNFLFKLGKGKKKTATATNVNNYTQANTNTVVTTQPPLQKPVVNITNPPTSPYNETVITNFTVVAKVYNVNQRSEVNVSFNGAEIKNYSWFGKTISFVAPLSVGNNIVSVTATNPAGNDSKSAVINFNGIPPQITITTPGINQHITIQSTQDLYATILNVESASYVSVKLNGVNFSSFTYNPANLVLSMQLPLIKGTNNVEITATNKFGKDVKTQLIIYNQPINTINTATATASRPVTVTFTDPAINPYKSSVPGYLVKAKVTGVTSANQINVSVNSVQVPFNYINGGVDFNVNLINGNNNITVSAGNGKSSDSKSTIINYTPVVKSQPPTVVILNPQPSPQTTKQNNFNFKAQSKFISDRSQLEVKFNGIIVSNFTFDASNGIIDLNTNLTLNSNNIFEVKATNPSGSQNASAIVKQEQMAGVDVGLDPEITICHNRNGIKQTITIKQSEWAGHQLHGDVIGACPKIEDPGTGVGIDPDIIICHNNNGIKQTITIKQSQWASHEAHGDVKGTCPKIDDPGTGVGIDPDIIICHNNNGIKQTITIKQSQWASHQAHGDVKGTCPKIDDPGTGVGIDPDIIICHKNGDGTETKMTIKQSAWAAHQAHGDYVGGNCSTQSNTATTTSTITICHKNGDGSTQTMNIPTSQYSQHRAHGDVMGACPAVVPPADPKITICHLPPGNNNNPQTIEIPESAWPAHLAHGDSKGACPTPTIPPADKKITICHIPPGNNNNPQTIEINESAWPAHQAHGDTKGACPEQKTTNPGGGKGKGEIKGSNDGDGTNVPGRTSTTQTVEPQKTEEPKTLKPR